MQDILKKVRGIKLLNVFDDRFCQISCFLSLKLINKLGNLNVIIAANYRHIMKVAIFTLDKIFDK